MYVILDGTFSIKEIKDFYSRKRLGSVSAISTHPADECTDIFIATGFDSMS